MAKTNGKSPAGKTPAAELAKTLEKLGVAQTRAAKDLGMQPATFKNLLSGKKKFEVETCLLVAKYTGTKADDWIELQKKTGLAEAKANEKLQKQLKELPKPVPTASLRGGSTKAAAAKTGAKKSPAKKKTVKKPAAAPSSSSNSSIWSSSTSSE